MLWSLVLFSETVCRGVQVLLPSRNLQHLERPAHPKTCAASAASVHVPELHSYNLKLLPARLQHQ